jgi:ElaB/YqjD/DUF883 family membrane-anchored ribosome-binding protein
MNTNRDVLSGSDLEMPSGFEVEAATFHTPVVPEFTVVTPERPEPSLKEKLNSLKSQSRVKLHEMQHVMNDKTAVVKSSLQRSMTTARSTMQRSMNQANTTVHTGLSDMQTDMRNNPMKWAGIAAGSGFALGLLGRLVSWRNKHRHVHSMPQLVIIESAC